MVRDILVTCVMSSVTLARLDTPVHRFVSVLMIIVWAVIPSPAAVDVNPNGKVDFFCLLHCKHHTHCTLLSKRSVVNALRVNRFILIQI